MEASAGQALVVFKEDPKYAPLVPGIEAAFVDATQARRLRGDRVRAARRAVQPAAAQDADAPGAGPRAGGRGRGVERARAPTATARGRRACEAGWACPAYGGLSHPHTRRNASPRGPPPPCRSGAAAVAILLVALGTRMLAVGELIPDFDEDDYLRAGQLYATGLQAGDPGRVPARELPARAPAAVQDRHGAGARAAAARPGDPGRPDHGRAQQGPAGAAPHRRRARPGRSSGR